MMKPVRIAVPCLLMACFSACDGDKKADGMMIDTTKAQPEAAAKPSDSKGSAAGATAPKGPAAPSDKCTANAFPIAEAWKTAHIDCEGRYAVLELKIAKPRPGTNNEAHEVFEWKSADEEWKSIKWGTDIACKAIRETHADFPSELCDVLPR